MPDAQSLTVAGVQVEIPGFVRYLSGGFFILHTEEGLTSKSISFRVVVFRIQRPWDPM
jgi:hypothetical protein